MNLNKIQVRHWLDAAQGELADAKAIIDINRAAPDISDTIALQKALAGASAAIGNAQTVNEDRL